ncbi:MAG TPA: hypothetical protein VMP01_08955 [Pirellulaceae bacterium]|nr:hypothetical protein [Pirellulaceae bacterium]
MTVLEEIIVAEKLKPFRVTLPASLRTPNCGSVVVVARSAEEALELAKGNRQVYPTPDYTGMAAELIDEEV